MTVTIREMTPQDFEQVLVLWQQAEGVGLSEADSPDRLTRFLEHNPGLSFVAMDGNQLVGAVLCGHDGRRGYIHHLAVAPSHQRQGIGRLLVNRCLAALTEVDIDKVHLFVFGANKRALAFWKASGWTERVELKLFSKYTAGI